MVFWAIVVFIAALYLFGCYEERRAKRLYPQSFRAQAHEDRRARY